jgi:hypothetical protein
MAKNGITARQNKAIKALLTAANQQEAAAAAGIGYRTLCRWLAEDSNFQAALTEAEGALLRDIQRELLKHSTAAVLVMAAIMESSDTDSTRLRAAQLLLEYANKIRQAAVTEDRMAEIESKLEAIVK